MNRRSAIRPGWSAPVLLFVIYGGLSLFILLLSPYRPRLAENPPQQRREPGRRNLETKRYLCVKLAEPVLRTCSSTGWDV